MCAKQHSDAVRRRSSSSPRAEKKAAPKKSPKKRKKHSRFFFRHRSWWEIWLGAILICLVYLAVVWFGFVGPASFRWKAIFGDPVYPKGYEVHGIDVSHYQATIDWERLRNAHIDSAPIRFVFIKATEGVSIIDENFNDNFYEARQNDFVRGAYHFFTPDVDAKRQAQFFLKQVHLEPGDLPPVLDVEKIGNLTTPQLRKAVKTWLDVVESKYGVKPILYTGYSFKLNYLNDSLFNAYPYWIAHYYVDKLAYKGRWHFWQHTDCGKIDGIKGHVDCNIFNGSVEDLMRLTLPEKEE